MVAWIRLTMLTRRTLSGKKGYLISGPEIALPGDVNCVLLGCDVPVILRQVAEHYILIGECYCQGIMFDEVKKKVDEGDSSLEIFEMLLVDRLRSLSLFSRTKRASQQRLRGNSLFSTFNCQQLTVIPKPLEWCKTPKQYSPWHPSCLTRPCRLVINKSRL
jgi:hypothetical protein